MVYLKKTSLAVLVLGSSVVFAGTMGPVCTPGNVTVPCENTAWDFGAQAVFLESLSSNNNLRLVNIGSQSGTRIYDELHYELEAGFRLEGSYHFLTGNDFSVNWIHWRDSNKLRLTDPAGGTAAQDTTASLSHRYYGGSRYDGVNAELGQFVDISPYKKWRIFGGAQYADIKAYPTLTATIANATGALANQNGTTSLTERYRFEGAGPRLGTDMTFLFGNGFGVYGNVAGALVVGTSKYSNNALFTDSTRPVRSSFTTVVPELEAKLGAKYEWAMFQGDVTIDAGYMVINYFDALHSNDLDLDTVVEYRDNRNFGLHGPYVGLKWVGNF